MTIEKQAEKLVKETIDRQKTKDVARYLLRIKLKKEEIEDYRKMIKK